MLELSGTSKKKLIILHGGAGPMDPTRDWVREATGDLIEIGKTAAAILKLNRAPLEAVVEALKGMENNPKFNAGYGSALQSDGQIRVTSSLMDGQKQLFSGVISAMNIKNPSLMAAELQARSSRVLTAPGTELLAREMCLPVETLITPRRLERWVKRAEIGEGAHDTVGAVVISDDMNLAAGSSTGGRGFEFPGRVSDTGTVAGNYASKFAAITCTGIGEEIVDDAVAARLEARCRDGMSLKEASHRSFEEARELQRSYGWIGVSSLGEWCVAHVTPVMTYCVLTSDGELVAASL